MASYVYGIIERAAGPPEEPGIGGAPLQTISSADAAALVSELPDDEQLALGREELLVHARVLERALDHGAVLPMRFGVVLEGSDAVRSELLEAHRDELGSQLAAFAGKVEMRLRVIYDEPQLMREVVAENPEIGRLRDQLRGQPEDATYFKRINLGELVSDAIDRKRERDTDAIMRSLEPHASASVLAEGAHERVVVTASFLVERRSLQQFEDAVETVAAANADRMRVTLGNPLPPHSFVQLAGSE